MNWKHEGCPLSTSRSASAFVAGSEIGGGLIPIARRAKVHQSRRSLKYSNPESRRASLCLTGVCFFMSMVLARCRLSVVPVCFGPSAPIRFVSDIRFHAVWSCCLRVRWQEPDIVPGSWVGEQINERTSQCSINMRVGPFRDA